MSMKKLPKQLLILFGFFGLFLAFTSHAETLTVKTKTTNNNPAIFQYRVPRGYDAKRKERYRVLVFFGGRNTNGADLVKENTSWVKWADEHGFFIIAPGFQDDKYWDPEAWSGKALINALRILRRRYNICTNKLLYYGYSAGSQAANLFAAWRPDLTRAWVSHACGVFHEPSSKMRGVPGLVTCGDADKARYIISRSFVENSRKKGVDIIWKSYPNHPHNVPTESVRLARAFLLHYHNASRSDLLPDQSTGKIGIVPKFIGDDQEGVYYPADSPKARNILVVDRVPLPSREIANAWGKPAK